jgi:hypothetical protein
MHGEFETKSDELVTETIEITPRLAEFMLTKNKPVTGTKGGSERSNRPMSAELVNRLATKIKKGLWQLTHQGIAFYGDGELADGQHRLAAIALAGRTVPVRVTRGLPRAAAPTIDIGRKRTAGQVMSMHGFPDGNVIAAALRLIAMYEEDWKTGFRVMDPEEIVAELTDRHPDVDRFLPLGRKLAKELSMTRGPAVAAAYITSLPDDHEFYRGLLSGADMQDGDPRLAMRRAFWNAHRTNRRRTQEWQIGIFGKGYLAWAAGRGVSAVSFRRDEQMPRWGVVEKKKK